MKYANSYTKNGRASMGIKILKKKFDIYIFVFQQNSYTMKKLMMSLLTTFITLSL